MRRAWLVAMVVTAGCSGGGGAGDGPGGSFNAAAGGQESSNWSGYVLTAIPGTFSSASGSWTVPAVTCAAGGGAKASSTWVGIGGGDASDSTLVQAGTEQDCDDEIASYGAWWEVIPAPAIDLDADTYPVGPGDAMTVSTDGSNAVVWTVTIHNASRGWTFTQSVPYTSAGATAEWVEEAPLTAGTGGAGQASLTNYGRVVFTGATANHANPGLTPSERVVMVDFSGNVISNPSAPAASGDAFAVCFGPAACE
jgi:hypothetical protein